MNDNSKIQITITEPTITPTKPEITPSPEPKITVSESAIILSEPTTSSAKPAIPSTEPTTIVTESRVAKQSLTSFRTRLTPIEQALFIRNHIKRPNQPRFSVKNPKGWFYHIESKIQAADKVEDLMVYNELLKELNDHDILCCILDVFQSMNMVNKYVYFKSHLLKKISQQERLIELLSHLKLDDKYPSALLNEMIEITGGRLLNHNLQRLWLQKLPPQVRSVISLYTYSLSSLSFMADYIKDLQCLPEINLSKEAAINFVVDLLTGDMHSKILTVTDLTPIFQKYRSEFPNDDQTDNLQSNDRKKSKKKSFFRRFFKCV